MVIDSLHALLYTHKVLSFARQCEECCHDSEDDLKPQEVSKDEPQSKFGRRIRKRGIDWETVRE